MFSNKSRYVYQLSYFNACKYSSECSVTVNKEKCFPMHTLFGIKAAYLEKNYILCNKSSNN